MDAPITLECRRITSAVGAVIEGLDLRHPLSATNVESVRQALRDYGVVFFRDQDGLTLEELGAFVSNFGVLQPDPLAMEKKGEVVKELNLTAVRQATSQWHADFTYFNEPTVYTGLRSVKLPPVGGDTCWASMYAAYDALSEPLRNMLDGLTAVHSMYPTLERMPVLTDRYAVSAERYGAESVHPVVIVHPETGRKALYVCEIATTRIVEVSAAESKHLLAMLFEHVKQPQFAMRWRWKPNDVALWDNRALQHFAVPDYTEERIMQSVRTYGEKPVGPRG